MIKIQDRKLTKTKRVYTDYGETESLTEQQHVDKVDVNQIIKRYRSGHEITHLNKKAGVYADLSQMQDYNVMLNQIMNANQAFDDLPAELRSRFNNNPAELIQFLADPKNSDEAVKLGLVEPKAQPVKTNDSNDQNKPKEPAPQKTEPAPIANDSKTTK